MSVAYNESMNTFMSQQHIHKNRFEYQLDCSESIQKCTCVNCCHSHINQLLKPSESNIIKTLQFQDHISPSEDTPVASTSVEDVNNCNIEQTTNYTQEQFNQLMDSYNKTYTDSGPNSYAVNPPPINFDPKIFSYHNLNNIVNYCGTVQRNDVNVQQSVQERSSPKSINPLFDRSNNNFKQTGEYNEYYSLNSGYNNTFNDLSLSDISSRTLSSNTSNTSTLSNTSLYTNPSNTSLCNNALNTSNISLDTNISNSTSNTSNTSTFASNFMSNTSDPISFKQKQSDEKNGNNNNNKSKRGRKKIDRSESLNKEGRYQCRLCPKSYKRYNDLKGHYLIHNENTQRCPYCKKKFTRPIYLRDHIRTHTGEKPFNCDICRRKFAAKRNLVQHRKKHFIKSSRLYVDQH